MMTATTMEPTTAPATIPPIGTDFGAGAGEGDGLGVWLAEDFFVNLSPLGEHTVLRMLADDVTVGEYGIAVSGT